MAAKEKAQSGMALINSQLNSGAFSNLYLLCGSEDYLLRQYKDKLVLALVAPEDTMNLEVFKGDSAKQEAIAASLDTLPFFAEHRVLLVEDSGLFKKKAEDIKKLDEALENIPESNVVIFLERDIDRTKKLYKTVEKLGCVANFDTPDEATLLRWIAGLFAEDEIAVEKQAAQRLVGSVGNNMDSLYHEVQKLRAYCMDQKKVTLSDVEKLCVSQVEDKIFDMMDALSRRDKKTTMRLYDDLLTLREPPMLILSLVTRQFRNLLKTRFARDKGCPDGKLASVLKVPPFVVKKYIAQANAYEYKSLVACVERCQRADSDIKSGRMRDSMAVELLILELLTENL